MRRRFSRDPEDGRPSFPPSTPFFSMPHPTRPLRWLFAAAALLGSPLALAEREPTLPAVELVSPVLLHGPGYRVEPEAEIHGYQARFRIHTRWGEIVAESSEILALRIAEMPALEALYDEGVTEALGASSGQALLTSGKAVAHVVMNPVDSVVGLPMGVVRYFGERLDKLGGRAKKLGHRLDQRISHEGSPYAQVDAPVAATRDDAPRPERPWWDKPARELTRLVKGEAGYGAARRELAARLGVDPYSSNPLLKTRLDALAWSATAGSFGVGKALALLSGGVSEAVGYAHQVDRLVLTAAPEDVRERNDERLSDLCIDEDLRYAFLHKGAYSPTLQTQFVDLLLALRPAAGCEALLETALMADSEIEARFMVNALRMVERHLGAGARHGAAVPQGAMLAYRSADGEFVLPLPVDYLSWTPQVRRWFDRPQFAQAPRRTLLAGGRLSPRAENALAQRGWRIVDTIPAHETSPRAEGPAASWATRPY